MENKISELSPERLQELANDYPYSSLLWFHLAKKNSAYGNGSSTLLNKAALCAQNPMQLYDFIHQPLSAQKIEPLIKLPAEESKEAIEHVVSPHAEPTKVISSPDTRESGDQISRYDEDWMPYTFVWWLQKTRQEHASTYRPYSKEQQAQPADAQQEPAANAPDQYLLDQQIRENIFHLQSPEVKLQEKHLSTTVPFKIPKKTDEVIDRFIREEPQIQAPKPEKINLENKARQSSEEQSGFVTETLASIYAEQGLYHKAIEVLKKLSLKYPEKSTYFAGQIEDLEKKLN